MNEKFLSSSALALLALLALLLAACKPPISSPTSKNLSPNFNYVPITGEVGKPITLGSPSVEGGFDVQKYTFAVANGDPKLPPGLTVALDTGKISGTPKEQLPSNLYTITATPKGNTLESKTATVNITVTGKADLNVYNPYFKYEAISTVIGTAKTQGFAPGKGPAAAGGGAFTFRFKKSNGSYSGISDTDEITIAETTGIITVTDQAMPQTPATYTVKVAAADDNTKWTGSVEITVSIEVTKMPVPTAAIVAGLQSGKVVIGLKSLASDETKIEQYVVQYRKKTSSGPPVAWDPWSDATDGSGGKKTFSTGANLTDATAVAVEIDQTGQFPASPTEKADYEYRLQSVVKNDATVMASYKSAQSIGIKAAEYGLAYSNVKTGSFAEKYILAGVAISASDLLDVTLLLSGISTTGISLGDYTWRVVDKGTATNGLAAKFAVSNVGQITTNTNTTAGNITVKAVPKTITATDGSIEATVGGDLSYGFEVFDKLTYTIGYTDVTGQMKDSKLLQNVNFTGSAPSIRDRTTPVRTNYYTWTITAPTGTPPGTVDLTIPDATTGTLDAVDGSSNNFKKGAWTVTASPNTAGTDKATAKQIANGDITGTVTVIGKKIVLDYSSATPQKGFFAGKFIHAGADFSSSSLVNTGPTPTIPGPTAADYAWSLVNSPSAAKFEVNSNTGELTTKSGVTTAGTITVKATPKARLSLSDEIIVSGVLEYDFTVFNQPTLSYSNPTVPAKSSGNTVPRAVDWFTTKPTPQFSESLMATAYRFGIKSRYVLKVPPPPSPLNPHSNDKIGIHTVTGVLFTTASANLVASNTFTVTATPKDTNDSNYNARAFAGGNVIFEFITGR